MGQLFNVGKRVLWKEFLGIGDLLRFASEFVFCLGHLTTTRFFNGFFGHLVYVSCLELSPERLT